MASPYDVHCYHVISPGHAIISINADTIWAPVRASNRPAPRLDGWWGPHEYAILPLILSNCCLRILLGSLHSNPMTKNISTVIQDVIPHSYELPLTNTHFPQSMIYRPNPPNCLWVKLPVLPISLMYFSKPEYIYTPYMLPQAQCALSPKRRFTN